MISQQKDDDKKGNGPFNPSTPDSTPKPVYKNPLKFGS
jgi:hypothetical protein